MRIKRVVAQPNRWTFTIPPIKRLIYRYVGDGKGWIDPFAGKHSPAELTNDLNPKMPTQHHLLAEDYCKMVEGEFKGVLFDPPYSYRQIKECYEGLGLEVHQEDTQSRFYNKVKNAICDKIEVGGYAISFGWTSEGFGKRRGFKVMEVLLVCHGGHHNDTIVTVEQKVQGNLL